MTPFISRDVLDLVNTQMNPDTKLNVTVQGGGRTDFSWNVEKVNLFACCSGEIELFFVFGSFLK